MIHLYILNGSITRGKLSLYSDFKDKLLKIKSRTVCILNEK